MRRNLQAKNLSKIHFYLNETSLTKDTFIEKVRTAIVETSYFDEVQAPEIIIGKAALPFGRKPAFNYYYHFIGIAKIGISSVEVYKAVINSTSYFIDLYEPEGTKFDQFVKIEKYS